LERAVPRTLISTDEQRDPSRRETVYYLYIDTKWGGRKVAVYLSDLQLKEMVGDNIRVEIFDVGKIVQSLRDGIEDALNCIGQGDA